MSTAELNFARNHMTAMDAMRMAIQDDAGVWRCVVCLAAVQADRIRSGEERNIKHSPIVTGYECLSCGIDSPVRK